MNGRKQILFINNLFSSTLLSGKQMPDNNLYLQEAPKSFSATISMYKLFFVILLIFQLPAQSLLAQNAAARYEIDAKRMGVTPFDKDALPRGREFVRLDSTYYVGWMYQGLYMNERSADVVGYQRALPLMRKAFMLLEKDYSALLKSLYSNPMIYMQNNQRYNDYLVLASKLREDYEFLEMPDSAMWVIKQVEKKDFRRDFFGIAGLKAWIIHRNRFYTTDKYSFLGKSVQENEQLALQACYAGFGRIKRNAAQNNLWFGEGHTIMDRHSIYHYLALIHCYQKNYDSSEYYYNQMAQAGTVSNNNYGSMKAETGEFSTAIDLYKKDQYKYGNQKFLMEPFYYLPILYVYSGDTKRAISTAQEAIRHSNSSPGFGWYNIALARSYLYDGQLDSASLTLDKAQAFHEIHIGTTLTQPQYEFSVGLLRLVWYNQKIAQLKFFNKGWWYSPETLYELASLQAQKYTHEYVLATQLALNPERSRIIYDLFCGESTVGYDEIWYLMKRYSPKYFMKLMEQYVATDPRPNIRKYFELYNAKLEWENGKKKTAQEYLEKMMNTVRLDTAHEKLFLGRLYESLAKGYNHQKNTEQKDLYESSMLNEFPQLIPFSELPAKVYLELSGTDDAITKKVVQELKNCDIDWQPSASSNAAVATVIFKKKGIKYDVTVSLTGSNNRKLVNNERFLFTQPDGAGKELAMRMFGASGAIELEVVKKAQ
jgi:hypothetical protein